MKVQNVDKVYTSTHMIACINTSRYEIVRVKGKFHKYGVWFETFKIEVATVKYEEVYFPVYVKMKVYFVLEIF